MCGDFIMRILDKNVINMFDCDNCLHEHIAKRLQEYKTREPNFVNVKICKFEKCPYEEYFKKGG